VSAAKSFQRCRVGLLLSGREQFSPYFGGALARWTYEVYSRLQEQVEVAVFGFPTGTQDLYPLRHETSGIWRACTVVSRIPRVRRYEEKLWLRALFRRLSRFDVLHIHNRPQWVAPLRTMGYKGSILLHLQNDHLGHWTAPMLDALAPKLNVLVVCSNYLRNTCASKSSQLAAKTRVVFNGADTELFCPREEIRQPKTILFAGRFDAEKGVLQLLQAYARVLQSHPEARLVVGGGTGFGIHKETAYVRSVRELAHGIEQAGNPAIHFTGYLDHDRDLPSWFQKATVLASPSLFQEPFGLVNAEAMACATPVVGSNRGGIPEVLGDTGRLVNPENTEDFAAAISELLSSPDLCRQLGRAACERCRKMFDWSVIAETWALLLEQLDPLRISDLASA
jgi:spore coat protein SA